MSFTFIASITSLVNNVVIACYVTVVRGFGSSINVAFLMIVGCLVVPNVPVTLYYP